MTPSWKEIRKVCEAAGLDMQSWEDVLHDRLLDYVLQRTKTVERYQTDVAFHTQIERLVGLVIGCICEHSPLVDPFLRPQARQLDDLFVQGFRKGGMSDHDDPLAWMVDARCRGLDPNLFVPSFNPDRRQGPPPEAFLVCNGGPDEPKPCPVRKQCFDYGVEGKATGCFGGKPLYNGKVRRDRTS